MIIGYYLLKEIPYDDVFLRLLSTGGSRKNAIGSTCHKKDLYMNFKIPLILGASIFFTSFNASANFGCGGTVNYLGMESNGNVFVSLNDINHIHAICSISDQGTFGVTTAACKSMYATLLLAKSTSRTVQLYYSDMAFTCATLPSWGKMPSTYFVDID